MSVRIKGSTIVMTRGDTVNVKVNIFSHDGESYIPTDEDGIRFALKKDYSDAVALIEKIIPTDTCILRLDSIDTTVLEQPGEYVYDIQITMSDGTVDTFIPNGRLIVKEEVL